MSWLPALPSLPAIAASASAAAHWLNDLIASSPALGVVLTGVGAKVGSHYTMKRLRRIIRAEVRSEVLAVFSPINARIEHVETLLKVSAASTPVRNVLRRETVTP